MIKLLNTTVIVLLHPVLNHHITTMKNLATVINAKQFSIIHINCRSLRANFFEIKNLLESLHNSFDVIVLSETWLNDNISFRRFSLYFSK